MEIKVPDNFRPSDYCVEISIPKPDMECEKNEDGSFSLRVGYNFDCISDLAREFARDMHDKMEAELMDELLRLNGYAPERTCKMENAGEVPQNVLESETVWFCSECGSPTYNDMTPSYCIYCGAKAVR